jgi:hypothetical protein
MAVVFDKALVEALKDKDSIKVVATVDRHNRPHAVFKENVFIDQDKVVLLELIETSQTNSNLVNSIWFTKTIAITVKDKFNNSWQIKGVPYKTHIAGALYEKYYRELSEKNPQIDLGAVWEIVPEEIKNQTFEVVLVEEKKKHPYLFHLDKIAKKDS